MRYLGIDYGKKRVGIALSDESGEFAMAHSVIDNGDGKNVAERIASLVAKVSEICVERGVGEVVLGESRDFKGQHNAIMKDVLEFKGQLERSLGLPVHFEPEFMTSSEAELVRTELAGDPKKLDSSAAALILKSYLDKRSNTNSNVNSNTNSNANAKK